MKFEFIDFYPMEKNKRSYIGTVHIYFADFKMDFRGIFVSLRGKSIFFSFPKRSYIDPESGKKKFFPYISWVDFDIQKKLMDFLHKEVKPIIIEKFVLKKHD